MTTENAYGAFISYSHRDAKWAGWLQRTLEAYRLPRVVARENGLQQKLNPIFRDREELSAGANLGDHLIEALNRSAALIVVCSPQAVQSQWVHNEIDYFKSLGKSDRIFCLLVEGDANSFPAPLLTDGDGQPMEPLAADPRDHADGKRLAKLKLLAGLLGVPLDQLARRDLRRQRQLRSVYGALAGVFLMLAAGAYWNWQQQKSEAQSAVGLVRFVSERWDSLRQYGLPMELVLSLAEEPLAYLEAKGANNLDRDGRLAFATLLRQQGIAYRFQNNQAAALTAFERSLSLYYPEHRFDAGDEKVLFERALGEFWAGLVHFDNGNYQAAAPFFLRYADGIESLYKRRPDHLPYAEENAFSNAQLVELMTEDRTAVPGVSTEVQVLATLAAARDGLGRFPDEPGMLVANWTALTQAALYYDAQCSINDLLPVYKEAFASGERVMALEQEQYGEAGLEALKDAGRLASNLGSAEAYAGNAAEAAKYFLRAFKLRSEVVAKDPSNEYMAKRLFEDRLSLFRSSFLVSDLGSLALQIDDLATGMASEESRETARSLALEEAWLQLMSERSWVHGNSGEAQSLAQQLANHLSEKPVDSRIRHFWALSHWLNGHQGGWGSTFAQQPQPPNGENCRDRFSLWSWLLANGNTEEADAVARNLWDKGYRHPRMTFYAKLAGTSYPPEGVTSP